MTSGKEDRAPKRRPTLADRFLAGGVEHACRYLDRRYAESLLRRVRAARKFVLDEGAAEKVGHVVRDIPELIIREHGFARPPFDLTWIEFPHWKFWEASYPGRESDRTADHTLGYLIDGNIASVITGGTIEEPDTPPLPGIFLYHLNTEWTHEDYLKFFEPAQDYTAVDYYLWGSTTEAIPLEMRQELRQQYAVTVAKTRGDAYGENYRAMLNDSLRGSVGELRNIVALLLMLNRPTITRFGTAPAGRGWIRNKNSPYMAHTTVHIDVDPLPVLRLLGTPAGEGVPRRRHEVRGHYCHDHEARIPGCLHEWATCRKDWTRWPSASSNEANHWLCTLCGRKRWWKVAHERGDGGRGYVGHDDYNVTTRRR